MPKLTLLPKQQELIFERRKELYIKALRVCSLLKHLGAKEVYLFGSILDPNSFGEHSDVDIAVQGLPEKQIYRIEATIEDMLGTDNFDLVYMEYVPSYIIDGVKKRGEKYVIDIPRY